MPKTCTDDLFKLYYIKNKNIFYIKYFKFFSVTFSTFSVYLLYCFSNPIKVRGSLIGRSLKSYYPRYYELPYAVTYIVYYYLFMAPKCKKK